MNYIIKAIVFSSVILYTVGGYMKLDKEYNDTPASPTVVEENLDYLGRVETHEKTEGKRIKYALPNYDTYFKTYMSYKAITNTRSAQYKLQQQAWTDENGLRRIGDDYIIAVGTFYSNTIGDRFEVTLANGFTFTATVGDVKADYHTDSQHMYTPVYNERGRMISANVLEFVVDTSCLPKKVRQLGTVSGIKDFEGNIQSIEKIKE